jgi:hypothetical protein
MIERMWFTEAGYRATVMFNPDAWHRCGYIEIPKSHPDFEKHCNAVDVSVHGGLTYSSFGACTYGAAGDDTEPHTYQQYGRTQSESEAMVIDQKVLGVLTDNHISHKSVLF